MILIVSYIFSNEEIRESLDATILEISEDYVRNIKIFARLCLNTSDAFSMNSTI